MKLELRLSRRGKPKTRKFVIPVKHAFNWTSFYSMVRVCSGCRYLRRIVVLGGNIMWKKHSCHTARNMESRWARDVGSRLGWIPFPRTNFVFAVLEFSLFSWSRQLSNDTKGEFVPIFSDQDIHIYPPTPFNVPKDHPGSSRVDGRCQVSKFWGYVSPTLTNIDIYMARTSHTATLF